jgi:putative tryptophan/tyrosine transport system substrate-binding protein
LYNANLSNILFWYLPGLVPIKVDRSCTMAGTLPKIGIMHSGTQGNPHDAHIQAFIQALAAAGYVDKKTVDIHGPRYADDKKQKLGNIANDFINKQNVNLLVAAGGSRSADVAYQTTNTTHTVFTSISSHVRPGQNMTGVCARTTDLDPDRLTLLCEMVPNQKQFGVLFNPSRLDSADQIASLDDTALSLGLDPLDYEPVNPEATDPINAQIDDAFSNFATNKVAALLVAADPVFNNHLDRIVKHPKLTFPAIYQWSEFVIDGGLMSYGPDLTLAYQLSGMYTGSILNGTDPASLPVVLLTNFEIWINGGTAAKLRIPIPDTLRARAKVI